MKDDEIAAAFGDLLRAARDNAGLSQERLAQRAGLDRTAVGQLERGESSPRLSTVMRLAGALGIEPQDLTPALRWTPPDSPTPEGKFSAI